MFSINSKQLRYTVFSTGLLAMALRWLLYATGMDQKGLLISNHWSAQSVLILTALVLGLVLMASRKPTVPSGHPILQGIGSPAAAAGILIRSIRHYPAAELLPEFLGFAAGLGLLIAGTCCLWKRKVPFLCHSAVCIFFALQMISHYRSWSADPQLMDYGFYLAAFICLMLTSYFLAGFEADMPNHRGLVITSMAAAFFCCLALPESGEAALLIPCAFWAFTCAPQMQAKAKRQRAHLDLNEETEDDHS